ncbi:DNA repair exonuclease SbcCD ATPase subunit [Pseudomonas syringae pv. actinidiae]|uniref:DNA repair exonuclease SbcCD ATPase subunit n=1 Tax=Pseudomonas syringae pv. actinidiae TaxID=103796 RepID=A0AAN4TIG0_PSESF|nr:DNA repair exonuclease SbcCD ATPase subunit [Pseudomonas syringae pv. actinidiae]
MISAAQQILRCQCHPTPLKSNRPKLLVDLRIRPQLAERHAHPRMQTFRGDERQWTQNEGIFENFRPGQNQPVEVADLLAIQQHIDIQRQTDSIRRVAAIVRFDEFQAAVQLCQRQIGQRRDHQIEERPALDTYGMALENRRTAYVREKAIQCIKPRMQVPFALDVAPQAEENPRQRHPRSISTPTPAAAATAPGLVSFRCSQGILNSLISTSARRSANVSTN